MTNENNEIHNPFYDLSQSITSSKSYAKFIGYILKQNRDMTEKNISCLSDKISDKLSNNQCETQQGMLQEQVESEQVEDEQVWGGQVENRQVENRQVESKQVEGMQDIQQNIKINSKIKEIYNPNEDFKRNMII